MDYLGKAKRRGRYSCRALLQKRAKRRAAKWEARTARTIGRLCWTEAWLQVQYLDCSWPWHFCRQGLCAAPGVDIFLGVLCARQLSGSERTRLRSSLVTFVATAHPC